MPRGRRPRPRPTSTRSPTPTTPRIAVQPDGDITAADWEGLRTLYARRAPLFLQTALPGLDPARVRWVPHHVAHAAVGDVRLRLRPVQRARARRPRRGRARTWPGRFAGGELDVLAAQRAPALARPALRGADRPPRLPPLLRRVQGDGDGVLRGAGLPRRVPRARARRRRRRLHRRARRPRALRAGARARARSGAEAHARAGRDGAAPPGGGPARPLRVAARAHGRPRPRDGRRRRAQLRGQLAHLAREPVRARLGAAGVGRLGHGARRRAAGRARARRRGARRCATAALGRGWDDAALAAQLATADVAFEQPDDVADAVAEALADNQVVAWFQGRAEFGPRALGHRSLLADPRHQANLEKLNDIKGREQFRPVAPMVLAERAAGDLRGRADPEPVHALHARRARRLGGADPGGRARGRHRAHPDRRPRDRSR